jgi:sucrose-phosphate synthase
MQTETAGLYLVLISPHGLIRSSNLELGRDADTGGQTKYVVELASALSQCPNVQRVDLLTRRIIDSEVSSDYSREVEAIADKANIIRIEAGPEEYLRKELLWDYLDNFSDNVLEYLREQEQMPDIIHSHYADAGYVGSRLSNMLGIPLVHTGHSLGRVKRRRLLASGVKRDEIENRYNMSRRIEGEEETLATARLVIASTQNEIEEQYGLYDHYQPENMTVIPPGTDLEKFHSPTGDEKDSAIANDLKRFLQNPDKPMILALSRPDERKNIRTLVKAYGKSSELQQVANLVIVAGNRDDIREMDSGPQEVMNDLLLLIDRYDLYGKVAIPKHHRPEDVSILYRFAAASGGVFINPALTEPFGLTLIEAAASGLPIVATEDGGPRDIIGNCHNGILIDPLGTREMSKALLKILCDANTWQRYAKAGLSGVKEHYSWQSHAHSFLKKLQPVLDQAIEFKPFKPSRRPMLYHDRAIFTDLDQNLLGDPKSLGNFLRVIKENRKCATFGIATGRSLESALKVMRRYGIPQPDVLITSVGTAIHYAPQLTEDKAWTQHIDYLWQPRRIRKLMATLPGVELQRKTEQSKYKISYGLDPQHAPDIEEINSLLRQEELSVNVFFSFGQFLDIVPIRASKGFALRYFSDTWDIPLDHVLAAGGSGTDEDMMRGNMLAAVVANRHEEELSHLTDVERIYFAGRSHAAGILEAIDHYEFFNECVVPPVDNNREN